MARQPPETIEVIHSEEEHPDNDDHINPQQRKQLQEMHSPRPYNTSIGTDMSGIQSADEPSMIEQHHHQQRPYINDTQISEIQPEEEPHTSEQQQQQYVVYNNPQSAIPGIQPNNHPHSQMGPVPNRMTDDPPLAVDSQPELHPPAMAYILMTSDPFADKSNTHQPAPVSMLAPPNALVSNQSDKPATSITSSGSSSFSWGSIFGAGRRGHPASSDSSNCSRSRRAASPGSWLRSGRQSPSDFDWSDTDSDDGRHPTIRERSASQGQELNNEASGEKHDTDLGPVVKSYWLQKEHKKQRQMRQCVSLACILCFIVLGVIIAFVFRDSIFGSKNAIPGNHQNLIPGGGKGGTGFGDTIESFYGVNKTITPIPGMSKIFYGLDYTPRGSQEPNCYNTFAEIVEDLKVISQLTNRIRLYGMGCDQAILVLKAIEYLELTEMKVVLTIWVDHNPRTSWEKQSKAFWDIIDRDVPMLPNQAMPKVMHGSLSNAVSRIIGVSVGNEVLFRNEDRTKHREHVPVNTLVHYIDEVSRGFAQRSALAMKVASTVAVSESKIRKKNNSTNGGDQNDSKKGKSHLSAGEGLGFEFSTDLISKARHLADIPVVSSDLGRNVYQIVDYVDQVMSNIHPFFASQYSNKAADWTITNYRTETVRASKGKQAIISEVGWPSGPASETWGSAVPSLENMQIFVNDWICKANKLHIPYYFFEAFDEPWKKSINPREAQWGIMTADRQLKVQLPVCE
ncbi:hypothetical protein BGW42_003822 [Actinomortierella wolfii]|nr:hypothetical protein BGW42_003822 [Actinomortierella wolfii]